MKTIRRDEKLSIVGAGNVGATLAQLILLHNMANVVLVDIDEGIGKGRAYDLEDASSILGYDKTIEGTSDFSKIKNSGIVIITAGFPRKPGMSREDLLQKNSVIVKDVSLKIKEYAPDSIIIVVTNPLDVMSYLVYKITGFDRSKVLGMAGILDSARCSIQAADELRVKQTEVESIVIGSHDSNMIPLFGYSKSQGKPFKNIFDPPKQAALEERTKKRGAEILSLLKAGSAYFAPSAACFSMVKSIINDERATLCSSVYLDGEYGIRGIFIGVPVVIGGEGIEEIVELKLSDEESLKLKKSADDIKSAISKLGL